MKKLLAFLLMITVAFASVPSVLAEGTGSDTTGTPVRPLVTAHTVDVEETNGLQPFEDFWFQYDLLTKADLSGAPGLAYTLSFSTNTRFPSENRLPAGYSPVELMEWGKYPGLNMDILHAHGFTGKGAVIAYADQVLTAHEEYDFSSIRYTDNTSEQWSMHGPTVVSMLSGKETGTAPEAELYYYAYPSAESDMANLAKCLYQLMDQNKNLPDEKKIRMVGFSNNIRPEEPNNDQLVEAVKACTESGVMVWFCGDYAVAGFVPLSDRNNFNNLYPDPRYGAGNPGLVHVPGSARTGATGSGQSDYIYWPQGGLSWTMPYMLGLYAIVLGIDPSLTQEEIRQMVVDTAFENAQGMRVIDPLNFVCAALRRVGRESEADEMLSEAVARQRYLYAVMDTAQMTETDLAAIGSYLASLTDCTPLIVDAAQFADAQGLYAAIRQDAAERGGTTTGVQIFGTSSMVPAFSVTYKVDMGEQLGIDDSGVFLTDLFYGNFRNEPSDITAEWNVMDDLADGTLDLVLAPEWPVSRLPLSAGEFPAFFEKYHSFVLETGLAQCDLVSFSSPIFAMKDSIDSFGHFLQKAAKDYKIVSIPYRLYGNKKGDYPVSYKALGDMDRKNLEKENRAGIREFVFNTHGQWNNIDHVYFKSGEEKRESFVNMDNINEVLSANPYYLDCWTCLNGWQMENNLTTTALNGRCVGMFSATQIISNNGVDWHDPPEKLGQGNFFCFYFHYLKALNEGQTRSEAFSTAQREYALGLMDNIGSGNSEAGRLQFNLYNLLVYHNFGVQEPNRAAVAMFSSVGLINQSASSIEKIRPYSESGTRAPYRKATSDGNPVGSPRDVRYSVLDHPNTCDLQVASFTEQDLDNGQVRYTVRFTANSGLNIFVFNPPDASLVGLSFQGPSGPDPMEIVYDLDPIEHPELKEITISFYYSDDDRTFLYYHLK